MCTVSFIAQRRGYFLGMNRDEKLTRPQGLSPTKQTLNGRTVIYPSEAGGGTWITLNDSGASFALINWYSVARGVRGAPVSRGVVVKSVSSTDSPTAADTQLRVLPLRSVNPFRLIGIFSETEEVLEWRWDLKRLVRKRQPWKAQQWISSGFDEHRARRVRSKTFQCALGQNSAGTVDWLRRLHRSHAPQCGPFSTCMHRSDAATVSYTEIIVSNRLGTMRYHTGLPCNSHDFGKRLMTRLSE
jgi:hypothetical protein